LAPRSREHLTAGADQLQKLNFIMENLIQTAAVEGKAFDLQLQDVEVNGMIREKVRQFALNTPKQIDFKSNAEAISIRADRFHLDNMLSNLIDNAIKYGGDRIEIETTAGKDGHWTLSVSDNGMPIAEADRPHIFSKFYRGTRLDQPHINGTGIGLFYVKTIVERHGGTIRLLHGKTFLIEL
jgi:two-component system phosphate regulon sensor histidine kinase PhoR